MFGRFRRGNESVAFAMSGGGSRGACQVGMLKALFEAGIEPSLITGTSAGAVNAGYIARFPDRLDELEAIWMRLRTRDVFPGGRVRTLTNYVRYGHIHSAAAWEAFLRAQAGDTRFEDAPIRCAIVAVRLSDGERTVFDSGEMVPAMMASTAIPGVFPPYRIGDALYVDGGVLEYLPLPAAFERGATVVYAMDCSYFSVGRGVAGSVVDRASRISASASVRHQTELAATRGRTVHHLRPTLPDFDDSRNFAFTRHLIDAGYEYTRDFLAQRGLSHETPREEQPSNRAV